MSPIDWQSRPLLASRARVQVDQITGEPVLLYPEGILGLNPTAFEIIARCKGVATVDEIANALAAEYEIDRDALAGDVLECLQDLQRRGLVTFST